MTGRPLTAAERLAEPTAADIAWRLADDAHRLAARIDAYHGPVDPELIEELDTLVESVRGLLRHGS